MSPSTLTAGAKFKANYLGIDVREAVSGINVSASTFLTDLLRQSVTWHVVILCMHTSGELCSAACNRLSGTGMLSSHMFDSMEPVATSYHIWCSKPENAMAAA